MTFLWISNISSIYYVGRYREESMILHRLGGNCCKKNKETTRGHFITTVTERKVGAIKERIRGGGTTLSMLHSHKNFEGSYDIRTNPPLSTYLINERLR